MKIEDFDMLSDGSRIEILLVSKRIKMYIKKFLLNHNAYCIIELLEWASQKMRLRYILIISNIMLILGVVFHLSLEWNPNNQLVRQTIHMSSN